ncbi:Hypothetical predicted protein [Pelobates cultripes]|uniref:Uncharacterized protein n=1 Tax=Pelobates cultripes TaxID=61616 RepID=A0AAD1R1J6_PELCU|nr:Hypothetical predicted protein [Pelobates cultripes]
MAPDLVCPPHTAGPSVRAPDCSTVNPWTDDLNESDSPRGEQASAHKRYWRGEGPKPGARTDYTAEKRLTPIRSA